MKSPIFDWLCKAKKQCKKRGKLFSLESGFDDVQGEREEKSIFVILKSLALRSSMSVRFNDVM